MSASSVASSWNHLDQPLASSKLPLQALPENDASLLEEKAWRSLALQIYESAAADSPE